MRDTLLYSIVLVYRFSITHRGGGLVCRYGVAYLLKFKSKEQKLAHVLWRLERQLLSVQHGFGRSVKELIELFFVLFDLNTFVTKRKLKNENFWACKKLWARRNIQARIRRVRRVRYLGASRRVKVSGRVSGA